MSKKMCAILVHYYFFNYTGSGTLIREVECKDADDKDTIGKYVVEAESAFNDGGRALFLGA